MIEIYEDEYLPTPQDDDKMVEIKAAVQSLRPVERKIWLTYVETGTYSATAREYNVSVPTASKYIRKIREKIMEKINDNDDNRPTTD